MTPKPILVWIAGLVLATAVVGQADAASAVAAHSRDQFNNYWYPKGAEISRFELDQSRYGEIHKGDAVLIFVTEPMNPDSQIKADHSRPENIPVLKLNATRKFYTGIYPYSVMVSTFSAVDAKNYPLPLKISATVQEWCGHVYLQMNLRGDSYAVQSRSYFEKEGDRDFKIDKVLPEDALLTQIRIAPQTLPLGEFRLIPGALYTRLLHRPLDPQQVIATLSPDTHKSLEGNPLVAYEIRFPTENRTFKILFEKDFPYRIQGWEDTYSSPKHMGGKLLTTRAACTHTLMIDYWNRHGNDDRALLQRLGLEPVP